MEESTFNLGVALGHTQAFGLIASRCTAAQAASLRRLREEKLYLQCAPDWRQFCDTHLNISYSQADRIISAHEEFGDGYFELAQVTRISTDTYRAIRPAIQDGKLHVDGEEIEINPENSQQVRNAVALLRPRKRRVPPCVHSLGVRSAEFVSNLHAVDPGGLSDPDRQQLIDTIDAVSRAIDEARARIPIQ